MFHWTPLQRGPLSHNMIYRKHRPQTWADITAQEHVTKTIQQEIISQSHAHAYIFCGPRGVGKTTSARLLAKSLNCKDRKDTAEPCNTCINCNDITASQSIDVIEIDAASHTGVDNVRENIIENARFTPTQSTYKIFIIDEVHMLSSSAFNALLKTIEEPPPHAIFIMATTELHKIPATILSRCQRFNFKHIATVDIVKRLTNLIKQENISAENDILEHVAWRAHGSMRDAESLLGQIIALAQDNTLTTTSIENILPQRNLHTLLSALQNAFQGNAQSALSLLQELLENGGYAQHICDDIVDMLRTLITYKTTGTYTDTFLTQKDKQLIESIAQSTELSSLITSLDITIKRAELIGTTPIQSLPLELIFTEIAIEHGLQTPKPPETPKDITTDNPKQSTNDETKTSNDNHEPPVTESQESENNHLPAEKEKPTQEESSENTKTPKQTTTTSLTIDDITAKWEVFLKHLHTVNHSLPFVAKTCVPTSIEGNTIEFTLPYEFHQKKLEEPSCRQNMHDALQHVYETELTYKTKLNPNADNADEVVAKVLNTFGGKIVNPH